MKRNPSKLSVKTLEEMYLREAEILKDRLLKGAVLKDIINQRNKTIQLALAIHAKQYGKVSQEENILAEGI